MKDEQKEIEDWDKTIRVRTGKDSSIIPPPTNYEEFEKQLKVFGQRVCESLQWLLSKKYPSGNKRIIEEELKDIYQFIVLAKDLRVKNTCNNEGTIWDAPADQVEYSRLDNEYYKENYGFVVLSECSTTARVYGKYFLFKDWLEDQLPKEERAKQIQKRTRNPIKSAFENFLNADGQKLIEHLRSEYHQAAPEEVFYMMKSLEGARCLISDIDQMNKTHLTDALTIFLDQKYTRQGLNLTRTIVDLVKLATHQNRITLPVK